jgi:heat-inducible transcriptional repressor
MTIPQTCKRLRISEQTFYRWRTKYGALKEDEAHRLKALEQEKRPAEADHRRAGVGYLDAAGSDQGKILTPARRRDAVAHLVDKYKVSERRACRLIGAHRSTHRYVAAPADFELKLVARMTEIAADHPRWGYRMVHAALVEPATRLRHVSLALSARECQTRACTAGGGETLIEDRKLAVLRAIVEDYVSSNEPVGSKALVERHQLGVSPATIRNDMSALEDEGYITQPHTSAGRVPTDKGYRLFVDRLSTVKPLSPAERKAIETFLGGAIDLDDVVHRTVRLLAQLTHQVAVVQYPSLSRSSVRHLELVLVSATRVLVVLITDTGRVEQRQVDVPSLLSDDDIATLRIRFNERIAGHHLADAPALLADLPETVDQRLKANATAILSTVLETLIERTEERVVLAGTANLARGGALDFPGTIRPVLEALEEHVVLLRLFGEVTDAHSVRVSIGGENPHEGLQTASIVTSGYGVATPLAGLGVLGPTRMDYPGTMGAVRAVARYVGQILAEG